MSCTTIYGPCQIAMQDTANPANSVVLNTTDGVTVNFKLETEDSNCDAFGKVDTFLKSASVEISFTPLGSWEPVAGVVEALMNTQIGAQSHGNRWLEIRPLVNTATQKIMRFPNAALVRPGGMTLSNGKPLWKRMTAVALPNVSLPHSDAARLFTLLPWAAPATAPTNVIAPAWQASYGAAPYAEMCSEQGWDVDFSTDWQPQSCDCDGVVNYSFAGSGCTVRGVPMISHADAMGLVAYAGVYVTGTNVSPGQSLMRPAMGGSGRSLVVQAIGGNEPALTLLRAGVTAQEAAYASAKNRVQAHTWEAVPVITAGVRQLITLIES